MNILNNLLTNTLTMFDEDDRNFNDILNIADYFQLNNVISTLCYYMTIEEYNPLYDDVIKNIFLYDDDRECVFGQVPLTVVIPFNTEYFDCKKCLHVTAFHEGATKMIFDDTGVKFPFRIPEEVLLFSCKRCKNVNRFTGYAPYMDFR